MAIAYVNMRKFAEAVTEYRQASAIEPTNPYYHNDLGMALWRLNELDEAIRHLSEALRLMPSYGQAAANIQFVMGLKTRKQ